MKFTDKMNELLGKHPMFKLSAQLSVNELVYMLRMDSGKYNVNIHDEREMGISMIPDVDCTFIPSRTLAKKILAVEQSDVPDTDYVCLDVYVADETETGPTEY